MKNTILKVCILTLATVLVSDAEGARERSSRKGSSSSVIDGVSGAVKMSYEKRDPGKLISLYAPHFMSSRYQSREEFADSIRSMFAKYERMKYTTARAEDPYVVEPYALEVADRIIMAERSNPPERITSAGRVLIAYEKCGREWLITGEEEIDTEAENSISGRKYVDLKGGYEVTVPEGWKMHVVRGSVGSMLMAFSGDMTSTVYMGRMRLPLGFRADEMLAGDLEVTQSLQGVRNVEQKDSSLAGMKGFQITADFGMGEKTRRIRRSYYSDDRHLLLVVESSESVEAFAVAEADVQKMMTSLKIGEPEIDPSLGSLKENVYRNRKYGCTFRMPRGYDARVEKGPGNFKVIFSSEDGVVEGALLSLDPPADISVELLVMADEYKTSQVGVNYELIKNNGIDSGETRGYETLSRFELNGKSRVRRRTYFLRDECLYSLLIHITPASEFTVRSQDVDSIVNGLEFGR